MDGHADALHEPRRQARVLPVHGVPHRAEPLERHAQPRALEQLHARAPSPRHDLEECAAEECDPALGNGGLGRLASCFLDSGATLGLPLWGYGIRYKYGLFSQKLFPGKGQMEQPDYWLTRGHPWEVERMDVQYPVRFYGHVVAYPSNGGAYGEGTGGFRYSWEGGQVVYAVAYDTPIPGYQARTVNNMRLWSSRPNREFDLASFNEGRYYDAIVLTESSEAFL